MKRVRKKSIQKVRERRGIATFWIIAAAPALFVLLVLVTDIGNVWLARVEAENAAESGALGGSNVWGDGADDASNRTAAHNAAETFTEANLVVGQSIDVDSNNDPGNTNNNDSLQCTGNVLLGTYTAATESFDAGTSPSSSDERACHVEVSVMVNSLWTGFFGPFEVRASATAVYDSGSGSAKLVRVTSGTCD